MVNLQSYGNQAPRSLKGAVTEKLLHHKWEYAHLNSSYSVHIGMVYFPLHSCWQV